MQDARHECKHVRSCVFNVNKKPALEGLEDKPMSINMDVINCQHEHRKRSHTIMC